MIAEYTKQLDQIAQALSRPPVWWQNPWILAALASVLGVIGGIVGQMLLQLFMGRVKLRTMRRMVYSDIVEVFAVADTAMHFPFSKTSSLAEAERHRRAYFKLIVPRMSEDYIRANPEVFARLPERLVAENVYSMCRHLSTEPDEFDGYLLSLNQIIAGHFKKNRLTVDGVRKYVGKAEASTFGPILLRYQDIDAADD